MATAHRPSASPPAASAPARRTVCLFCSASDAVPDSARDAARAFGRGIAAAGLALVFGGGTRGLMGQAAGACFAAGGEVIGVIPKALVRKERGNEALGTLHVVDTLSQRKQMMADLSDCFVCLPGGVGTLDETIEMITWFDLRLHSKPVFLCNVDGFWDPFRELMERWRRYGVLRPHIDDAWRVLPGVGETLDAIECYLRDGVLPPS